MGSFGGDVTCSSFPKKYMPAIVTLTLHPCIDVNISVPALVPDIKMTCSQPLRQPGGGGINVARAIHQLGGQALAVYLAGGCTGEKLGQLLESEGVDTAPVAVPGETRENLIIREEGTGLQYRCNLASPPMAKSTGNVLLRRLSDLKDMQWLVVSGSLAPGMTSDIFPALSAMALKNGVRLVVDTAGDALRAAVKSDVYLVKPSLHELMSLTKGRPDGSDIAARATQLLGDSKTEAVVVSLGAEGAMLVTRDTCRRFSAPRVDPVSTIGAGDSLVAGVVLSLYRGKSLPEAVGYGCLCGAAATLHPGTGLCRLEDVNRLQQIMEKHEKDPVDR